MIGIPYRVLRHGENGPVDKLIYLATRRYGDAGSAMKAAKLAYQKHTLGTAKATQKYVALERRAAESADREMGSGLDELLDQIQTESQLASEAAEKLVLLSLTENYGKENAMAIMDDLVDADIRKLVSVIETGELPKDFFESGGHPPKPTTTLPSGDLAHEHSSKGVSPAGRSNGEM